MSSAPPDPKWSRLLGLSVHEFRTPMTVVAGYIRMLLKDRAGPLSDQQRRLLEEAEKSCGRLTALLTEVSDLSNLEALCVRCHNKQHGRGTRSGVYGCDANGSPQDPTHPWNS